MIYSAIPLWYRISLGNVERLLDIRQTSPEHAHKFMSRQELSFPFYLLLAPSIISLLFKNSEEDLQRFMDLRYEKVMLMQSHKESGSCRQLQSSDPKVTPPGLP